LNVDDLEVCSISTEPALGAIPKDPNYRILHSSRFGLHGAGGTLGAVPGVFATNAVNDAVKNAAGQPQALGLVDGNAEQVPNQVIGCAIAWGLAVVGSLVILKICDPVVGLRVSKDEETQGLDVSQHGEEGYILEA
jgi:Amt family ammonium transporter